MDFLHDQLNDGRRFRILAIVEVFTRECLALVADSSLSGLRVGRELDAIIAERRKLAACVSDNGNGREFCGREDRHPYELFLQLEDIEHKRTRVNRQAVFLFGGGEPFLRPGVPSLRASRAGVVKTGQRPPPPVAWF
jgi:hypothetical protein